MTIVSEDGRFEWDSVKDKENRRKHLLSFEEILDVFDDPAFLEIDDEEHSVFEERFRHRLYKRNCPHYNLLRGKGRKNQNHQC